MMPSRSTGLALVALALFSLGLTAGPALAAEAPRVKSLRIQQVKGTTYFCVRFAAPKEMHYPLLNWTFRWWDRRNPELARLPQLVPQDKKTQAVYPHVRCDIDPQKSKDFSPTMMLPGGLEFIGKLTGQGKGKFLLLYPLEKMSKKEANQADNKGKNKRSLAKLLSPYKWVEVPVTLDFGQATRVRVPHQAAQRNATEPPGYDDLEALWGSAQAARFAVLEAQTSQFGFYAFAREVTGRKYRVPAPSLGETEDFRDRMRFERELYETTTGAAAIAESLALRRMLTRDFRDTAKRTVDVATVSGITIAEHPWQKMMGKKRPSPEPLAGLVPHDNYYVHFKSIAKFIEFGELLDQWGTSLARAYEVTSRDYGIKERLEKQLCLRSTLLGKTFGPLVVKSLAVTGSDGYLREGSDVTVLFQVADRKLFKGTVDGFIREARKEFGKGLHESKQVYHKIPIESYATALREVSLHRAMFGDYVVYSNSPAGLRRVIDTYQGRHKRLSNSLDFQYMRTVFRLEDKAEDGFVFLSDAFIRQLVGPASKIKEKRRLEGLTSLFMTTHAALFTAWETGKMPAAHGELLEVTGLKAEEIYTPEGKGVVWDGGRKIAVSDVYNTLHFATPLVELPIDKVTPGEAAAYKQFREDYLTQWRRYFDPVGIRVAFNKNKVRLETYILPLINNSRYNDLREWTGSGMTTLDLRGLAPNTFVQFLTHLSPTGRKGLEDLVRWVSGVKQNNWLGDWVVVRLDDSPVYSRMFQLALRRELDPEGRANLWEEEQKLFAQIPLTLGVGIHKPKVFAEIVKEYQKNQARWIKERHHFKYKDVPITKVTAKDGPDPIPTFYHAMIEGGWYISLSEPAIKDLIDRSVAREKEKARPKKTDIVKVNTSLYISPTTGEHMQDLARFYLEWETHYRALANAPIVYALYRTGQVDADSSAAKVRAAAMQYLGFVPASADDSANVYEGKTDEVVNGRHGTLRRPRLHAGIEKSSPLGRLLESIRSLRADLRFKEDGINTVVTLEKRGGAK
jgi:hypothetical protein